jgi:hypothetical protein
VAAPTRHTTRRLFAVNPDMAEFLADGTLLETSLSFIRLYLDCNMAIAIAKSPWTLISLIRL